MINKSKIFTLTLTALVLGSIAITAVPSIAANKPAVVKDVAVKKDNYSEINTLELVKSPQSYLNAKVKTSATFERFSTLGLDYKPALRESKNYISFLIRRPDSQGDYAIPLSELKLIIKRDKAEKLIDLEPGDKIEFTGQVFSTALNDPWVDVDDVKVLVKKNPKSEKAETAKSGKTETQLPQK